MLAAYTLCQHAHNSEHVLQRLEGTNDISFAPTSRKKQDRAATEHTCILA